MTGLFFPRQRSDYTRRMSLLLIDMFMPWQRLSIDTIRKDFSAWGSYLGVALSAGAAVGALLVSRERT